MRPGDKPEELRSVREIMVGSVSREYEREGWFEVEAGIGESGVPGPAAGVDEECESR